MSKTLYFSMLKSGKIDAGMLYRNPENDSNPRIESIRLWVISNLLTKIHHFSTA